MSWEQRFHDAVEYFMQSRGVEGIDRVIEVYQDEEERTCGEGTCWTLQTIVEVTYFTTDGESRLWVYDGGFADLIKEL